MYVFNHPDTHRQRGRRVFCIIHSHYMTHDDQHFKHLNSVRGNKGAANLASFACEMPLIWHHHHDHDEQGISREANQWKEPKIDLHWHPKEWVEDTHTTWCVRVNGLCVGVIMITLSNGHFASFQLRQEGSMGDRKRDAGTLEFQ